MGNVNASDLRSPAVNVLQASINKLVDMYCDPQITILGIFMWCSTTRDSMITAQLAAMWCATLAIRGILLSQNYSDSLFKG